jgi:phosphoribosylanthranilate isomerase
MRAFRIKICGVTNPSDAAFCAEAGADALGINFYPRSPRFVAPHHARELLEAIPPLVSAVGVFVEKSLDEMQAIASPLGLRAIQYHGPHAPIQAAFPSSLIPAFRVHNQDSLDEIERYLDRCQIAGTRPGAILIDSYVEGVHGGSGQVAPWHLLTDFRPGVPIILAGGLTPDNVAEAIDQVRPAGVDVASGVEKGPGIKDHEKVRLFLKRAHEAATRVGLISSS